MIKASLPLATTIALVRKLVMVLETIEKLPVYLYDSSNGGYGLQILTRRLRLVSWTNHNVILKYNQLGCAWKRDLVRLG